MERSLPCEKHEEQIKTLFKQDEAINKRIDGMDWMRDTLTKLTTLMEITIDDNKKRDEDNRIMNEKQNETLANMNQSLIEINNSMSSMNTRIGTLEEKVEENEDKNLIDIRNISKEKEVNKLKQWIIPASIGGVIITTIGTIVIKIIEVLKG